MRRTSINQMIVGGDAGDVTSYVPTRKIIDHANTFCRVGIPLLHSGLKTRSEKKARSLGPFNFTPTLLPPVVLAILL
jgi:hypothetical protein